MPSLSLALWSRAWTARSTYIAIPHARSASAHARLSYPPPPPARRRLTPAPSTSTSTSATPNTNASAKQADAGPARRPTNRQIPFTHVYLLDPDTNKLSPTKHRLEDLFATHVTGTVSNADANTSANTSTPARGRDRPIIELVTSTPHPIVRLTTRALIEARYKDLKRALKQSAKVGKDASKKEVQLTWGVAPADMAHKMRKARRDLDKGYRVDVVVAVRHGHRPSSREALSAFGDEIAEALAGAGRECKERQMTGRSMVLTFRKAEGEDAR